LGGKLSSNLDDSDHIAAELDGKRLGRVDHPSSEEQSSQAWSKLTRG
jgi:hypothetical protein